MTTTMQTITKAELEAAKKAARVNAEGWVDVSDGQPFDGADQEIVFSRGYGLDDVHAREIEAQLGLPGRTITMDQMRRIWPVYRAALELYVFEMLAATRAPTLT